MYIHEDSQGFNVRKVNRRNRTSSIELYDTYRYLVIGT